MTCTYQLSFRMWQQVPPVSQVTSDRMAALVPVPIAMLQPKFHAAYLTACKIVTGHRQQSERCPGHLHLPVPHVGQHEVPNCIDFTHPL